jgi:hypothetical protein
MKYNVSDGLNDSVNGTIVTTSYSRKSGNGETGINGFSEVEKDDEAQG